MSVVFKYLLVTRSVDEIQRVDLSQKIRLTEIDRIREVKKGKICIPCRINQLIKIYNL